MTTALNRFPTFATLRRIMNTDGHALYRYAGQQVDGCGHCQIGRREHGSRWGMGVGYHQWTEPGAHTRKLRILAKRHAATEEARHRAEHDAMVAEVLSWPTMEAAAPKMAACDIREGDQVLHCGEWYEVIAAEPCSRYTPDGFWLSLERGLSLGHDGADLVPARRNEVTP